MFKIYQANCDIAFNVKVDGGTKRIVFEGQSHGTSSYSTRDAKEQKGIESHYWFNDKFFLREAVDEKKQAAEAKKKAEEKAKQMAEEKNTRIVTDIADAKDYLADRFGVSRSKMKTKGDVLAVAKENGVELEGL